MFLFDTNHISVWQRGEGAQWFLRFDGDRWDEQIEKDASSGKLDSLAQAALRKFRSGQTNPL